MPAGFIESDYVIRMTQCPIKHDEEHIVGLLSRADDYLYRVTYQQAEADTKRLAARLIAAFGHSEVTRFQYAAIPRGGLIVLGMLSYVLDLDRDILLSRPSDAPLIVVDDCSLSGVRFGRFLQAIDSKEVIFAHLYSHPDLRTAIKTQEPRVVDCLSANNLRDLARARYLKEQDYLSWQERWRRRLQGPRYWIGQSELVIFPWSEPDRPFWNPLTDQVEDDWRLTPPDRCLKNWARLGMPPHADARATMRSPEEVAYNLLSDKVILCDLRTEQVYGLDGVAADMWRALAAYGDMDVAIEYLLGRYDVDEAKLRSDLSAFAKELMAKGLLEGVDNSDVPGS